MIFFLGIHEPAWMARTDVPLFVSRRRLVRRKTMPRARGRWALDSGGFTELSMHGRWTVPSAQYAAEVRRFRDEIGGLEWAAPQDWMCEPFITRKTGRTVAEHQRLTVANLLELRSIAPDLPWVHVGQGRRARAERLAARSPPELGRHGPPGRDRSDRAASNRGARGRVRA